MVVTARRGWVQHQQPDGIPHRRRPGGHPEGIGARPDGCDGYPSDADAGNEARRVLSGINDDGYFGDASGQWLNLEPNARITLHASADADPWLEVKEFARVYGAPFVWGILTVVVAVSALIWWSESRLAAGERAAEAGAASDSGPGRRLLAGALGEATCRRRRRRDRGCARRASFW